MLFTVMCYKYNKSRLNSFCILVTYTPRANMPPKISARHTPTAPVAYPTQRAQRAQPTQPSWFQRLPLAVVSMELLPFVGVDFLFGCARGPFERGQVEIPAVRLGRLCKLLHAAARQLDPDGKVQRPPHVAVPSDEYPNIAAAVLAVESFHRARVTCGFRKHLIEIRLGAGDHNIIPATRAATGNTAYPGALTLGSAFVGVTMRGAGLGRTRLTGGQLNVEHSAE